MELTPRPMNPPPADSTSPGRRRRPSGVTRLALGLASVALSVALVACDDGATGGGDAGASPDPAEAACASDLAGGAPVVAADERVAGAPEVRAGDGPFRVTVPPSGTGYVRFVTHEANEAAIFFFAQTAVLTEIYDDAGAARGVTSAGANPFCPADIPEHFDVEFGAAGTHYLELTSAADVWLLATDAAGHGD